MTGAPQVLSFEAMLSLSFHPTTLGGFSLSPISSFHGLEWVVVERHEVDELLPQQLADELADAPEPAYHHEVPALPDLVRLRVSTHVVVVAHATFHLESPTAPTHQGNQHFMTHKKRNACAQQALR